MARQYVSQRNSKCWSFTHHTEDYELGICGIDHTLRLTDHFVGQLIINVETAPTTGSIHFQGCVWLLEAVKYSAITHLLPELDDAHFEVTLSAEATARYCRKEETAFDHYEWIRPGFITRGGPKQPKGPSVAERLAERCMEMIEAGDRWNTIALDLVKINPAGFGRCAKQLSEIFKAATAIPKALTNYTLRPWQTELDERITATKPDGRTITWVYDPVGNNGKSWFCNYLIRNRDAVMVDGRTQDMAYAYNGQPIVCIDIARGQADNMDHLHVFAEKVASGNIFSSKYESVNKVYDNPPHVIVFANVHHDSNKWTAGRCLELDLAAMAFAAEVGPAVDAARATAARFM